MTEKVAVQTMLAGAFDVVGRAARSKPFAFLLGFNFCLILIHIWTLRYTDSIVAAGLRIDEDGSIPEKYESVALLVSAAILLLSGIARKRPTLAILSLIIFYMMVDNYYGIHEIAGEKIYSTKNYFGELIFFIIFAIISTLLISIAIYKSETGIRNDTLSLVLALILFSFFSVGVDIVHTIASSIYPLSKFAFAILEDGGEMICISLILSVSLKVGENSFRRCGFGRFRGRVSGALRN